MGDVVYEIPSNEDYVLYAYLIRQNTFTLCRLKTLYILELESNNAERIKNAEEILACIDKIEKNRESANA